MSPWIAWSQLEATRNNIRCRERWPITKLRNKGKWSTQMCLQMRYVMLVRRYRVSRYHFHPYLGKIPILTHIFQKGLKPPTRYILFLTWRFCWKNDLLIYCWGCLSGRFMLCGRIAYMAQNPWIQNASLKENILFGHTLHEDVAQKLWYWQRLKFWHWVHPAITKL